MTAMSDAQPHNRPAADFPVDQVLDVKGYNCPLPILKTKVALNRLEVGQILLVMATDPMAEIDFRAYCARTGHELLHLNATDDVFTFVIRKAAATFSYR